MHANNSITTLERLSQLVDSIEEIAISYAESREIYNWKSANVDNNFIPMVLVTNEDPKPKFMLEFEKRSY